MAGFAAAVIYGRRRSPLTAAAGAGGAPGEGAEEAGGQIPAPPDQLEGAAGGEPLVTVVPVTTGCSCRLEVDPDEGLKIRVTHPKPGRIGAWMPLFLAATSTDVDKITVTCSNEGTSICRIWLPQKTVINWSIVEEKIDTEVSSASSYDRTSKSWMNWTSRYFSRDVGGSPFEGRLVGRYGEGREARGEQVLYYPAQGTELSFHGHHLKMRDAAGKDGRREIFKEKVVAVIKATASCHTWNLAPEDPVSKQIKITIEPVNPLEYEVKVEGLDDSRLEPPKVRMDEPKDGHCACSLRIENASGLEVYETIQVESGKYTLDKSKYPPMSLALLYQGQPAVLEAAGEDWDKVLGLCDGGESDECKKVVNDPDLLAWTASAGVFPVSSKDAQVIWLPPWTAGTFKLHTDIDDSPVYDDPIVKDDRNVETHPCRLIIYGHRHGVGHVCIGIDHWGEKKVWGHYPKGDVSGLSALAPTEGQILLEDPESWTEAHGADGTLWRWMTDLDENQCLSARRKVLELMEAKPDWWALGYNCVSFVYEVAEAAGQSFPGIWKWNEASYFRSCFPTAQDYSGGKWPGDQ